MNIRTDFSPRPAVNEFHVHNYGHSTFYTSHACPTCEREWLCLTPVCQLEHTVECLACATHDLLCDVERVAKEASKFTNATVPTDGLSLRLWESLRQVLVQKLNGLAKQANELLKRQEQESATRQ